MVDNEWPQVDEFGAEMKKKLTFCRDVKKKTGWLFDTRSATLKMFRDIVFKLMFTELGELTFEAVRLLNSDSRDDEPVGLRDRLADEAVDIGNLAMMVFDITRRMK